jgi:endonuclease/exonuclease/phosphatase family metal-dependent hydrolase
VAVEEVEMGSLFGTPIGAASPYVQGYPAYAPAPQAASSQAQIRQMQAELKDIRRDINAILASLNAPAPAAPAVPSFLAPSAAPAPSAMSASPLGSFNQIQSSLAGELHQLLDLAWQSFDWLFGPHQPAQPATPAAPSGPSAPTQPTKGSKPTSFVISSFNVLGNSHTEAGGEKPELASGVARMRGAVQKLQEHHVDVVGFQEMQHPQMKEFKRLAGNQYAVYSTTLGRGKTPDTENSIAWRKDKWELVKGDTLDIPYFEGSTRHIPVVLLRNKQTGQEAYFLNTHNPADTAKHHQQERYRDEATRREVALVNRLKQTGLPVFVTGDMNEKNEANDHFSKEAGLQAAMAGAKGRLPKRTGIDWIFGSKGVSFSGWVSDSSTRTKGISDHPMVVSRARIG